MTETLTLQLGREQTREIIDALRQARNDLADAIESKAARAFPNPQWDHRTAREALADSGNGWDFGGLPMSTVHIGGGIEALQIDLDGEPFIWITESLADGQGWQACLYLGADHDGYYLTGYDAYPKDAEQLRQTVADLIAARDRAAAAFDALSGLAEGTGVALVLHGGGVQTGTLVGPDSIAEDPHTVTILADQRRPVATYKLTDVAKVRVI